MGFDFRNRDEGPFGPPPPPFRIRRQRPALGRMGGWNRWIFIGVALILIYIVLNVLKTIYVDWLWFEGAGFRSVYSKILVTRVWLFFGGAFVFLAFFGANVALASRTIMRSPPPGFAEADAAALRRLYLLALIAGSIFLAILFGTIASGEWNTVLQFLNAQSFGVKDPQFHKDVGFYVFQLPALKFFQGWAMGALVLTTIVVAGLHLMRFLLVGTEPETERTTRIHLSLLLVAIIGLFIFRYWLGLFSLDFSNNGVVFGATYTDVHARIPVTYISMALAGGTIAAILVGIVRRGVILPVTAMAVWILIAIVGGQIYPATVQRFSVQPNELAKESPYIQRNIDATRQAFNLDKFAEQNFPAASEVTQQEINADPDTVNNIRLLDPRPLLDTYRQIQSIRPLYEFLDIDVDRYVINGVRRQVMLSPRELSAARLPSSAQTWVNTRLHYTHGYGVVVSPVNEVVQEGLPSLIDQDIPVTGAIPISRPQIYYGEEPDRYVVVKTNAQEFDYPSGSQDVLSVFDGGGGVKLGSFFRRLVLAWEFKDFNILISGSVKSDSRLLWRRNISERVRDLAPFLTLDRDPYLVIADGQIYWIQDAYTTTSRYPYAKPSAAGYNYIRNSVKVVINAYDGTTTFYVADPNDPILKTYAHIFPKMFTPLDQMPASLQAHIRYPEDLFSAEVSQYLTYHITDPNVLYKKEDIWNIPSELNAANNPTTVQPYYVTMTIPGESKAEFVLILPLTLASRDNTIAWVAARSDPPNYGKLVTFRFPTESLVFGPRQVESRIDQDPNISAQFSLWNQSGSRVIRGNLLMIPIGKGNLFVEPIYLQAETSQLPELKRVVVANGNNIAMEPTLTRSLDVIFGRAAATPPGAVPGETTPPPAGATPVPSPTAAPVPTSAPPPASGTPVSVADLARQADAAYQQAQAALKNGDFATYGTQIARVEDLIRQIVAQTGGQ